MELFYLTRTVRVNYKKTITQNNQFSTKLGRVMYHYVWRLCYSYNIKDKTGIKAHSSKIHSHKTTNKTLQKTCTATTVSYLHVGIVLQFLLELHYHSHRICAVQHEPQLITIVIIFSRHENFETNQQLYMHGMVTTPSKSVKNTLARESVFRYPRLV